MGESVKMASKRDTVSVFGLGQHVVATEEEETKEIRAGDMEISIVSQQPARASVTTGILQIRWTDDGDGHVAALATMYIAEVPNESSVS